MGSRAERPDCTALANWTVPIQEDRRMTRSKHIHIALCLAAAFSAGCTVSEKDRSSTDSAATAAAAAPITPAPATTMTPPMTDSTVTAGAASQDSVSTTMRVEVDLTARKVRFINGQDSAKTYPVAVGSKEWPTKTGDWTIKQVVWNPEWTPPDESWAEQKEPRKPGDPKNPLGRAQLVYDPPRTIHGTNEPASIGKAVSHGSIRMRNADIVKLGRELMELSGVAKDSAFYQDVAQKRTEKVVIDLPKGIPIRVF